MIAEDQSELALRSLAFHASQAFEGRRIIYNGSAKMSCLDDVTKSIGPGLSLVAREEKISVDLTYRISELNEIRNKIIWFTRPNVRSWVTCIKFGLRVNMTLREITEGSGQGRLPTKFAAALEMMIR